MNMTALDEARGLAGRGEYGQAREVYLRVLRADADCVAALVELGALAEADGYGQAAFSAYSRAVAIDSGNIVALTGLGNLLSEQEDYAGAKRRYSAALEAAPAFAPAHQGLARCLTALGEAGAEAHFRAGFGGHAVVPGRGASVTRIPLLLLAAARGGNVPCKGWIDPALFSITTLYADFFEEAALPPHDIVVNAIGDAELCDAALLRAKTIVAASGKPVINDPERVRQTTRARNAERLRGIAGVVTPQVQLLSRDALRAVQLRFPLLLRSPGFHTGRNFVRVESVSELDAAIAALPGEALLAIEFLDARGPDGMARKYRAMFIDGQIYPLHMAASVDWKVHYFTSAMAGEPRLRAEEQEFLEDMEAMLGAKAMAALRGVEAALGLDYAGVDFGLDGRGNLIVFEANATMIILDPDERSLWDYRRPAVGAAQAAAKALVARKAAACG